MQSVSTARCKFRPIRIEPSVHVIARRLRGKPIDGISRLGKRVVIHSGDWRLVLQPKMTGLVSIDLPPDPDHVRLRIELSNAPVKHVLFWDRRGLGTVQLVSADELLSKLADGKLGPDALVISLEEFIERLRSTQRAVKVALLDQAIVAGIGNLYASEMLHSAKIHPARSASKLSVRRVGLLYAAMLETLNTAIAYEGSTLSDGAYRNALNHPGSYQNAHRVYDREHDRCPSCQKSTIKRIVQSQRSTFFCPQCQKR